MKRILFLAAMVLAGCPKNEPAPTGAEAVSEARAHLADRERKLSTYRFHGVTTDLATNEPLGFSFVYRAPGKMRGETEGKAPHVFAFDGKTLAELDVNAKKLTTYDISGLPRGKADEVLHQIFAPFAPEGFRAPLLPSAGLTAARSVGAEDKPQVELTAKVADGNDKYDFHFVFHTPAMDLVEKEVDGPNGALKTTVVKQACDAKSGLCFPVEILETLDAKAVGRTNLSELSVNGPVNDAEFTLAVPPGGTEEKKTLAAAP